MQPTHPIKLDTKVNDQMEVSGLAKATIVENHRKPRYRGKETFEKKDDDVKANSGHIVPRLQEPSSEKIGTAGLIKNLVGDLKATDSHIVPRLQEPSSEKLNIAKPRIKSNET